MTLLLTDRHRLAALRLLQSTGLPNLTWAWMNVLLDGPGGVGFSKGDPFNPRGVIIARVSPKRTDIGAVGVREGERRKGIASDLLGHLDSHPPPLSPLHCLVPETHSSLQLVLAKRGFRCEIVHRGTGPHGQDIYEFVRRPYPPPLPLEDPS
jgi:hypothetical protein